MNDKIKLTGEMTEPAAAPKPKRTPEQWVLWNVQWKLDQYTALNTKALGAVATGSNSRWAILDDLADLYAAEEWRNELEQFRDDLTEMLEKPALAFELLKKLQERVLWKLLSARTGNSTSGAANLISQKEIGVWQEAMKLVNGWVESVEEERKQTAEGSK